MQANELGALYTLTRLHTNPQGWHCYYSSFTDEETDLQPPMCHVAWFCQSVTPTPAFSLEVSAVKKLYLNPSEKSSRSLQFAEVGVVAWHPIPSLVHGACILG